MWKEGPAIQLPLLQNLLLGGNVAAHLATHLIAPSLQSLSIDLSDIPSPKFSHYSILLRCPYTSSPSLTTFDITLPETIKSISFLHTLRASCSPDITLTRLHQPDDLPPASFSSRTQLAIDSAQEAKEARRQCDAVDEVLRSGMAQTARMRLEGDFRAVERMVPLLEGLRELMALAKD